MARRLAAAAAPFLTVFLLAAVAHSGEIPGQVDPSLIPAYRVIAPGVAAAGQPTPAGLQKLKELGFRTVVNLRTPAEGPLGEEAVVRAQGLGYVSVPVTTETLSVADALEVEQTLADRSAAPVLLHCASSNRVGALWALILARQGRSLEQAEAAGRAAGMRSPALMDAVRRALADAPPRQP